MKKLLGILVLGLLWCNVGFAAQIVLGCEKYYDHGRYNIDFPMTMIQSDYIVIDIDPGRKIIHFKPKPKGDFKFAIKSETDRHFIATREKRQKITIDRYTGQLTLNDISKPKFMLVGYFQCKVLKKIF